MKTLRIYHTIAIETPVDDDFKMDQYNIEQAFDEVGFDGELVSVDSALLIDGITGKYEEYVF